MFINKDSIIVNGTSLGPYLLSARYEYPKLWAPDTGRNLAGTTTGTLIGIFPKIVVTFRKLTKAELNIIAPILDSETQTVQYYDPNKNAVTSISTYTGDWQYENKVMREKLDSSFNISFISRRRRS